MFNWQIKTAFLESKKNKLRFSIAILVIGLATGMIIVVNNVVDDIAHNYAETAFTNLSNADVIVEKENRELISNVSLLSHAFEDSNLQGISYRFYLDSNILFTNEGGEEASFPTQILGMDLSQEKLIGLGEFDPEYSTASLGLNQSLLIGNFGRQAVENIGTMITTKINLPNGDSEIINLEIIDVVEQYKRLPRGLWNVIIVNLDTIYQFIESNSATTIVGVFKDHNTVYSVTDIDGTLTSVKSRGIAIQKTLGFDYIVNLPLAKSFENVKNGLDNQRIFLNFIIIIVLLITGILIYGLTNIAVEEKTYDFGVFRALGLKNRHIILQAFLQACIKGFIGIIGGILFGYLLTMYFLGSDIPISFNTYLFTVIMGSLLILFSALQPVIKSTKKQILISLDLSKTDSTDFQSRISSYRDEWISWRRIFIGLGISSFGIIFFLIVPALLFYFGQQSVNSLGLGILILSLLGFIFIIIGALGPIMQRILMRIFSKLFFKTSLGVKIFLRKNVSRNNITIAIFAITLSFVFFMTTLQTTTTQGMIYQLQVGTGSDLVITPVDPLDQNLNNDLLNFTTNNDRISSSFITKGSILQITGSVITVGDDLLFNSFTPNVYATNKNLINALFPELELTPGSNFTAIDDNETIAISSGMAKNLNIKIGDSVRVQISSPIDANQVKYGKDVYLDIVAIINRLPGFPEITTDENIVGSTTVFIGTNTWQSLITPVDNSSLDTRISWDRYILHVYVRNLNSDFDLEDFKTSLFIEFGTSIHIVDFDEQLENMKRALESSTNGIAIILSLSVILALFAVISSTSTSVTESKIDIGILKSIGLKNGTIAKIFVLEAVIIAISSTLLGGLAGYLTAYLAAYNNAVFQNWPFFLAIPPVSILFTYFFALLLAVIGAYIPSRGISRLNTIDILRK